MSTININKVRSVCAQVACCKMRECFIETILHKATVCSFQVSEDELVFKLSKYLNRAVRTTVDRLSNCSSEYGTDLVVLFTGIPILMNTEHTWTDAYCDVLIDIIAGELDSGTIKMVGKGGFKIFGRRFMRKYSLIYSPNIVDNDSTIAATVMADFQLSDDDMKKAMIDCFNMLLSYPVTSRESRGAVEPTLNIRI